MSREFCSGGKTALKDGVAGPAWRQVLVALGQAGWSAVPRSRHWLCCWAWVALEAKETVELPSLTVLSIGGAPLPKTSCKRP